MRHACPATWPDKTIWAEFYYGFVMDEQRNVMFLTHCKKGALYPTSPCGDSRPRLSFERSSIGFFLSTRKLDHPQ